jgi:cytochrome P450
MKLARLEGQIALQNLFTRWPHLALALPEDELQWSRRLGLRALAELPVTLE